MPLRSLLLAGPVRKTSVLRLWWIFHDVSLNEMSLTSRLGKMWVRYRVYQKYLSSTNFLGVVKPKNHPLFPRHLPSDVSSLRGLLVL